MAALKNGDVLECSFEGGCAIKIKVVDVCGEVDCDMKCCGEQMTLATDKEEKEKGDTYGCTFDDGCGLKVQVIDKCGEFDCDLVCCGKQMNKI